MALRPVERSVFVLHCSILVQLFLLNTKHLPFPLSPTLPFVSPVKLHYPTRSFLPSSPISSPPPPSTTYFIDPENQISIPPCKEPESDPPGLDLRPPPKGPTSIVESAAIISAKISIIGFGTVLSYIWIKSRGCG